MAEDRFRAVQIREGTIGFADVPGYFRVAEQLIGESRAMRDDTWG